MRLIGNDHRRTNAHRSRSLRPVLVVLGFGFASVACGGGGDGSAGSVDEFCDVLADLPDVQQLDPTDPDDLDEILAFVDDLREAAPSDLDDEIDVMEEFFQAFADGDEDLLDDPDFADEVEDASRSLERYAERECDIDAGAPDDDDDSDVTAATTDEDEGPPPSTDDDGSTPAVPPSTADVPSVDATPVEVVESAIGRFESYDEPQGTWVVLVRNPNDDVVAEYVEVLATFRDAAGMVVGTAEGYLGEIGPGETRAVGDDYLDDFPASATTIDVVVATDSFRPAGDEITVSFREVTVTEFDEGLRVLAEVTSDGDRAIDGTSVTAVFRDPSGVAIGASSGWLDFVPAGTSVGVEIATTLRFPAGSVVELYSDHASVFYDDPVSVEPVVVEDGFSLFEQWGSLQGSWAAIVENPSTQALRYVSLIATLRDANGSIVDVDTGSLSSMAPGSRSAYGSDYLFDVPPTAATVEVAVHASDETATTGSGSLSAGGTTLTSDGEGGWNVAGEITSTLDRDVEFVEVIGVFRGASGVIVGGAVTYVDLVPAQGAVGFTLDTSLGRTDALTVEVFVDHGDAFDD